MKLEVEISDDLISDQLLSARVSYWGRLAGKCIDGVDYLYVQEIIAVEPTVGYPTHALDIKRGLRLAITKYPRLLDPNQMDDETGDMFVQLCAFGELRYG